MPHERTRLITLGTAAGPPPRAHRAQSSNLLIVSGTPYVIDAGDGAARRLAKAGVNARDVGTIFITHHHDDHTAGLGTLMSVAWDQNRTKPIHVYGPPRTEDLVKAAVQYFTISAEIRISDGGRTVPIAQVFFGHDVGAGMIYEDANIKVTAVENTHFSFHRGPAAGKHKSYSYRFETPDRVIVVTSDTGPNDAVTEPRARRRPADCGGEFDRGSQARHDQQRRVASHDSRRAGRHRPAGHGRASVVGRCRHDGDARRRQVRGADAPDVACGHRRLHDVGRRGEAILCRASDRRKRPNGILMMAAC